MPIPPLTLSGPARPRPAAECLSCLAVDHPQRLGPRRRLAAYKVPRAVHFVDELPTTSSGKIMRRMLRQPADVAQ